MSDPDQGGSRDIHLILHKDQTLRIREELADKGFFLITASTVLEGYGGNSIYLTATRERSRLDLITSTTDEANGFTFNVAVGHQYPEQA